MDVSAFQLQDLQFPPCWQQSKLNVQFNFKAVALLVINVYKRWKSQSMQLSRAAWK